jgi:hypothetical protein
VRRSTIQRKHFIRKQSAKRYEVAKARRDMLEQNRSTVCQAASLVPEVKCQGQLDPHEPLTRARGGSITDPDNLIWLCRAHHSWVHSEPTKAHELGLLQHSWESA